MGFQVSRAAYPSTSIVLGASSRQQTTICSDQISQRGKDQRPDLVLDLGHGSGTWREKVDRENLHSSRRQVNARAASGDRGIGKGGCEERKGET